MASREVPVTYDGVMIGVAEVEGSTADEIGLIVKVRLNEDSVIKPFFIDHTIPAISISGQNLGDEDFDPDRLCNSCDGIYGHDGECGTTYTKGL